MASERKVLARRTADALHDTRRGYRKILKATRRLRGHDDAAFEFFKVRVEARERAVGLAVLSREVLDRQHLYVTAKHDERNPMIVRHLLMEYAENLLVISDSDDPREALRRVADRDELDELFDEETRAWVRHHRSVSGGA